MAGNGDDGGASMAPADADDTTRNTTAYGEEEESLSVEAVVVDYYMNAPLPQDALVKLPTSPCYLLARHVPVLRVFGATPAGQKTCVHIHGLFPYFYFRAEDDPAFDDPEQLRRLLPRIAMELEKANELKQQQHLHNRNQGNPASRSAQPSDDDPPPPPPEQTKARRTTAAKLVAKLLIVQGTPFYGYHAQPRLFVQIFLYNPRTVASVVQLLESGCIAERVFQPYEAHIPFLLQVFADYNIEGMNALHLSNFMFRAPLPATQEHLAAARMDSDALPVLLRSNVPSSRVNGDVHAVAQIVKGRHARTAEIASRWFDRQSTCALEVDVAAECILNPQIHRRLQAASARNGNLRNVPSLAALWEEERQRRIQNGDRSTPEFTLSVERNHDSTQLPSPTEAQSAASSLLSQSFFRQKMQDATAKIIKKMMNDHHKREGTTLTTSAASNRDSLDDVALAGTCSSIVSSGAEVSSVLNNNTIATESVFSFSQVEHDQAVSEDASIQATPKASDHYDPSEHEDQAIMELLLSMQHTTEPTWEEQVRSQLSHGDDDEIRSISSEMGASDDENVGGKRPLDEIGDILASQMVHETETNHDGNHRQQQNGAAVNPVEENAEKPWWDVVDDQPNNLSSASSVLEFGSPRLELRALGTAHPPWSQRGTTPSSSRARRQIDLDTSLEDSEALDDIEDLLPPPPPPPPRSSRQAPRRRLSVTTAEEDEEEEDSVPFDPLLVSLTPQPMARRRTRRSSTEKVHDTPASPPVAELNGDQNGVGHRVWSFEPKPPTIAELLVSSKPFGIEAMEHRPAHFSVADDIPEKPLIFSDKKFDFTPVNLANTRLFDTAELRQLLHVYPSASSGQDTQATHSWMGSMHALLTESQHRNAVQNGPVRRIRIPVRPPPTVDDVTHWCLDATIPQTPTTTQSQKRRKRVRLAEPLTTSLESKRLTPRAINSNLTTLSVEVYANSRGVLLPNPHHDRVEVICYAVEAQEGPTDHKTKARGVIMCRPTDFESNVQLGFCVDAGNDLSFEMVKDEKELLAKFEELVQHWDPDFLAGFEVQKESIGFLVDRGSQLKMNLIQSLSRLPTTMVDARNVGALQGPENETEEEESGEGNVSIGTTWGVTKASGLWIHGRFILNLWRLTRSEVKLSRNSREDIVRAVLHRELPIYSAEQLTTWYQAGGASRWKVVHYTLLKAKLNLQLLSRTQLITRTSEMARLFGMDFYSVLSRGSQYRVESMMLRVSKRRNYILVSPNRPQVARQAPMESIPLVMEPHSSYYADPVVVLDFQSLYPSLVIAYNLCYSTIYGRLRDGLHADLEPSLGVMDFVPSAEGLIQDRDDFILAPNGVLLSSKPHRMGVLPVILDEILSTRIMVKNAMKTAKQRNDTRLEKVLNARQLALKLLANVTYGYTAAGFSGRMPCAQLADSIVQSGRCTLEAAVRMVESNAQWNAKVVYGDTDSLFVLLRGRSKDDAFRIGQEIADAVTASNPKPVTLKLEKVYMGCILVSKKRYVGLKYESPSQRDGVLESKGVEVVRRDSCGVVQTSMQRCLELLFATSDLSRVKQSLEEYWIRMLEDQLPLKDFLFAKEVRLGTYARGSAPPAALVSAKAMAKDPRAEPRYAERVPYLVVNGPPGARLLDLVVSPSEFLDRRRGPRLSINYQYYIHKQMIPSLERLFLLMGANVRAWYTQLPRTAGKAHVASASVARKAAETRSIDSFYASKHCRLCGAMGRSSLCDDCAQHPQRSEFVRQVRMARRDGAMERLRRGCMACGGREAMETCGNVTCGVWNRMQLVENGRDHDEFAVTW